jgi:hypothetical protein
MESVVVAAILAEIDNGRYLISPHPSMALDSIRFTEAQLRADVHEAGWSTTPVEAKS